MKSLLIRHSQGNKILLMFVITSIIYSAMLFVTIPNVTSYAAGMTLLDMLPMGYDHDYAIKLLDTLGEAGRNSYLKQQIPLDMLYPGLFAVTFSLIFTYLIKAVGKVGSPAFYLAYLPVIAGVFDYLENVGIITMINTFPDVSVFLVKMTSIFSVIKSVSTTIFFIALIIFFVIFLISTFRTRNIT